MLELNKVDSDGSISKANWIDYTYSMLEKDEMGIPTDQSVSVIKSEIVKVKSILCRWTCDSCGSINNQKDIICVTCGSPSTLPNEKGTVYYGRMITNDNEIGTLDIKMEIQRNDTTIQGLYWCKTVTTSSFSEPLSLVGFVTTRGMLSMKIYKKSDQLGYINGTLSEKATMKFVYADSSGINGTGTVNCINKSDSLNEFTSENNSKTCIIS